MKVQQLCQKEKPIASLRALLFASEQAINHIVTVIMATITLGGKPIQTAGDLPAVGSKAPDFRLTRMDLQDIRLSDFAGKNVILNIFPSVETGVCASSTRTFNKLASELKDTAVICVSKDLPFAFKRFCGAEGIDTVVCASEYKDRSFSENYHTEILNGGFAGLMSRAVVVVGPDGNVRYTEQVPDIGQEPAYDKAIAAL
jgi:thiol peroxidase